VHVRRGILAGGIRVAAFGLLASVATAFGGGAPADTVVDKKIGDMTNEDIVVERQRAMREDRDVLRTASGLQGDEAVAAATTLLQNFTNFPALFREGSLASGSRALPIIWQQWPQFEGIFDEARSGAGSMLEAARAGDDLAYGDMVRGIGQVCDECHQVYRGAAE
jgi:cytochrome c556